MSSTRRNTDGATNAQFVPESVSEGATRAELVLNGVNDGATNAQPVLDGATHAQPVLDGATNAQPVLDGATIAQPVLDGGTNAQLVLDGATNAQLAPDGAAGGEGSSRLDGRQVRILLVLFGSCLLFGGSIGTLIPVFPVEARRRDVPQTLVGAVLSAFCGASMVAAAAAPWLVSALGASRTLVLGVGTLGVSVCLFGTLDAARSMELFVAGSFVTRFTGGLGVSTSTTAGMTIVASQFPARVSLLVATSRALSSLGQAIGQAVGGVLYTTAGYAVTFLVVGGTCLAVMALSGCALPRISGGQQRQPAWRTLRDMVIVPETWVNVLIQLISSAYLAAVEQGLAPYSNSHLGVPPDQLGLLCLPAFAASIVAMLPWGWFCDRLRNNYIPLAVCLVALALGTLLIAPPDQLGLTPSGTLLAVGETFHQIAVTWLSVPTFANLLRAAGGPAGSLETEALVSGVWWGALSAGLTLGPLVGGALHQAYGYPAMVALFSGLTLLLLVPVMLQWLARRRELRREQAGETARLLAAQQNKYCS